MSPTPVRRSRRRPRPPRTRWEATDEEVAARYGIPVEPGRPVRPQHLARPAGARRRAPGRRPLRDAAVRVPAVRLPPPRRGGRGRATASTPDEILVGAGADEILDMCAKAFLAAGEARRRPDPDLRDVPRPDRAARRRRSSRSRASAAAEGWALDLAADPRRRARRAAVVWLCSPNNPTGLAEPDGAIERAPRRASPPTPAADGRPAPVVVLDEAYAEFVGTTAARAPRRATRTSSSSGPRARPTRWPGCGSGSRSPGPRRSRGSTRTGRPGSVSTVSVTRRHRGPARPRRSSRPTSPASTRERTRLADALRGGRLATSEPSVTNFILVDFGTPERAAARRRALLLRRGLVPRTFGAGHPLAALPPR